MEQNSALLFSGCKKVAKINQIGSIQNHDLKITTEYYLTKNNYEIPFNSEDILQFLKIDKYDYLNYTWLIQTFN
jgi:hypothetical protein